MQCWIITFPYETMFACGISGLGTARGFSAGKDKAGSNLPGEAHSTQGMTEVSSQQTLKNLHFDPFHMFGSASPVPTTVLVNLPSGTSSRWNLILNLIQGSICTHHLKQ